MAPVTYDHVTIRYPGASAPSVNEVTLQIADGEFLVLVGPSGCGKSTTLRALAGLEPVESGRIFIGEEDVTEADPADRDVAMVFQNYALYPHLTVRGNMSFALDLRKTPKKEATRRIEEAARILGLTELLDRKPKDLSGGQRQRVAMGRAIVRDPRVFLMDEPLSNLDAKLRVSTRSEIAALQRRLGTTTVYVTHDQVEAMTMGDRVAVLNDGVLQQVAAPRELYRDPVNLFVAGFIGSPAMNLFHDDAPVPGGLRPDEVTRGVRPEDMRLEAPGAEVPSGRRGLAATVEIIEELGSESYVYARRGSERLVARLLEGEAPRRGAEITLSYDPRGALLFGPDGLRLRG